MLDEVPTPKFNGAISTNLTWKGFTLNANFTFATGAMIIMDSVPVRLTVTADVTLSLL